MVAECISLSMVIFYRLIGPRAKVHHAKSDPRCGWLGLACETRS